MKRKLAASCRGVRAEQPPGRVSLARLPPTSKNLSASKLNSKGPMMRSLTTCRLDHSVRSAMRFAASTWRAHSARCRKQRVPKCRWASGGTRPCFAPPPLAPSLCRAEPANKKTLTQAEVPEHAPITPRTDPSPGHSRPSFSKRQPRAQTRVEKSHYACRRGAAGKRSRRTRAQSGRTREGRRCRDAEVPGRSHPAERAAHQARSAAHGAC